MLQLVFVTVLKKIMKHKIEYLVDTGILLEHLCFADVKLSVLEKAMHTGVCYTTVSNSSGLFFAAENEFEKMKVKDMLSALKVLGVHSRYSLTVGEFAGKVTMVSDALFCVSAKLNRLTILTLDKNKYIATGLSVIGPDEI